jgi:hypothetical protein
VRRLGQKNVNINFKFNVNVQIQCYSCVYNKVYQSEICVRELQLINKTKYTFRKDVLWG